MALPFTFAGQKGNVPAAELDANFAYLESLLTQPVTTPPVQNVLGAGPVIITLGSAYTAGRPIGSSLITFSVPTSGILQGATLLDASGNTNSGATYLLPLFVAAPTAPTNNANYAPSAADLAKATIPLLQFATVFPLNVGSNIMLQYPITGLAEPYAIPGGTTLYGILLSQNSGPTFATANDIIIYLSILPDQ